MKKFSLKLRLILSFLGIAGAIWLFSGLLAWQESREQIDEFFDTYQLAVARQLATANWEKTTANAQKNANKIIDTLDDEGEEEDEALAFAVFDNNGTMIFHDNENGRDFIYNEKASGFVEQKLGKKLKPWRIVWVKSIDRKHKIAIGQEIDYRNETALEMIEGTFLPWGVGLLILLIAAIWMIYAEFKPLQKIANKLIERESDDLSPITNENIPLEVTPLVEAINGLFIKISEMIKNERSFISDAAHELRSPLTALNVLLDVVELAKDDLATQQQALKHLREGLTRSSHLVEQMLALSKLDNILYQGNDLLNWKTIINQSIDEQKDAAIEKSIDISLQVTEDFSLEKGENFLWMLLLRNLLDNAIRYSEKGAWIKITVLQNKIIVCNNTAKFDSEQLSRLGERFFRPSGQKSTGSGLGLSIVERIASLHNCSVKYTIDKDIFTVAIEK